MQIYVDFLSFFFLANLSATSAQGLLIYDHVKKSTTFAAENKITQSIE